MHAASIGLEATTRATVHISQSTRPEDALVNVKRWLTGTRIFDVLMLVLALFLLWRAYLISGLSSPSSPGAFPMISALIMVVAVGYALISGAIKDRKASPREALPQEAQPSSRRNAVYMPLFFFAAIVAYALTFERLGFLPASFLFLVLTITVMHGSGIKRAALISISALAFVYVVFRLVFKVVLPEGIVPEGEILAFLSGLFR